MKNSKEMGFLEMNINYLKKNNRLDAIGGGIVCLVIVPFLLYYFR